MKPFMTDEYRRFWIDCTGAEEREWLLAEAFEAGAEGAEEDELDGRFRACIYIPPDRVEDLRRALESVASDTTEIGRAEKLPEVDWSEAWKEGLVALVVSPRLVVRPPFVEVDLEPGQREVVIDPGQAFGTGAHASTSLCLDWLDHLLGQQEGGAARFDRVLDVGTGSGVLALAALALGAQRAVGFDLDPVAIEAAEQASRENGLEADVHFWTGPIEALAPTEAPYPLVLANLLKREMLPIASEIARKLSPEGRLVLAGLLDEDVPEVLERFSREGLVELGRRRQQDAVGNWVGLCLGRS
jgi:ribosomal protein L11 methyltransferase